MSFSLPDLRYDYSALEPYIDARTMEIHHSKHHQGYTTKLNAAIEILGERSDVIELMNEASLGVLSSDIEGLPVALLEYGSSKLAVVTTDVGHCREVINGYGLLVSPGNCDELADALLAYIADPVKRMNDASNFAQNIASKYSSDSVLPKIIKIYKEVLY